MNLSILPINVMLAHSWRWLTTPEIREALLAHPMGAALLAEIEKAHERLAEQSERRRQLEAALQRLTDLVTQYDGVHDTMARAIHGALDALARGARNSDLAAVCFGLQKLLFPEGLGIVSRSYVYEAGAIEALQRRVTPEVLGQLAALRVGDESLADWYHAWVQAGQALGRHVQERAHLLKSTSRGGTGVAEVASREARRKWVRTVYTFLSALDLMDASAELRERILSTLEASIQNALRGRTGSGNAEAPAPDQGTEPGATPDAALDAAPAPDAAAPDADIAAALLRDAGADPDSAEPAASELVIATERLAGTPDAIPQSA